MKTLHGIYTLIVCSSSHMLYHFNSYSSAVVTVSFNREEFMDETISGSFNQMKLVKHGTHEVDFEVSVEPEPSTATESKFIRIYNSKNPQHQTNLNNFLIY